MPSGMRATRATTAATAGAAVVMPAATVKPLGGSLFPALRQSARSIRLRRSARSIAPSLSENLRPILVDQLQLRERFLPMPRQIARFRPTASRNRDGSNLLDQQRVERPGEIRRQPQALPATLLAIDDRCQRQQPLGRLDRRRQRLLVDPVERPADPLVELRVADRDQARQQQAVAARPERTPR